MLLERRHDDGRDVEVLRAEEREPIVDRERLEPGRAREERAAEARDVLVDVRQERPKRPGVDARELVGVRRPEPGDRPHAHGAAPRAHEQVEERGELSLPRVRKIGRGAHLAEGSTGRDANATRGAIEDGRPGVQHVEERPRVEDANRRIEVGVLVEGERRPHGAPIPRLVAAPDPAKVTKRAPREVASRRAAEAGRLVRARALLLFLFLVAPLEALGHERVGGENRLRRRRPRLVVPPFARVRITARQAIERDHEVRHELVVTAALGGLEEVFDEALVKEPIAPVVDVVEEGAPHLGARVRDPRLGERRELLVTRARQHLVEEPRVARAKELVDEQRRSSRRRARAGRRRRREHPRRADLDVLRRDLARDRHSNRALGLFARRVTHRRAPEPLAWPERARLDRIPAHLDLEDRRSRRDLGRHFRPTRPRMSGGIGRDRGSYVLEARHRRE